MHSNTFNSLLKGFWNFHFYQIDPYGWKIYRVNFSLYSINFHNKMLVKYANYTLKRETITKKSPSTWSWRTWRDLCGGLWKPWREKALWPWEPPWMTMEMAHGLHDCGGPWSPLLGAVVLHGDHSTTSCLDAEKVKEIGWRPIPPVGFGLVMYCRNENIVFIASPWTYHEHLLLGLRVKILKQT